MPGDLLGHDTGQVIAFGIGVKTRQPLHHRLQVVVQQSRSVADAAEKSTDANDLTAKLAGEADRRDVARRFVEENVVGTECIVATVGNLDGLRSVVAESFQESVVDSDHVERLIVYSGNLSGRADVVKLSPCAAEGVHSMAAISFAENRHDQPSIEACCHRQRNLTTTFGVSRKHL